MRMQWEAGVHEDAVGGRMMQWEAGVHDDAVGGTSA